MNTLMPTQPGQICKIVSAIPDLEAEEVFIVTENPADFEDEDEIRVVSLTQLQRNIGNPDNAERISVAKNELVVVAENLEAYVKSWNVKE
ncbi:hypothetical protein [Mucilaginibacter gotjawali]|uniref:Uncharacterized protein n=2 Tax=Mucilaginibacter gotjawali TaxID=1550579 RepID=A0A110AZX8_9SPHI|nr:hypothetical protein [Mucilaginibacter gotjawali]MBB3054282.1 hypothetical protein [Mucilaginibacter gotjawali]BAU51883.1 hypothetical protein MgSA37_00032 [Mucilaginibacter gotjawali]